MPRSVKKIEHMMCMQNKLIENRANAKKYQAVVMATHTHTHTHTHIHTHTHTQTHTRKIFRIAVKSLLNKVEGKSTVIIDHYLYCLRTFLRSCFSPRRKKL